MVVVCLFLVDVFVCCWLNGDVGLVIVVLVRVAGCSMLVVCWLMVVVRGWLVFVVCGLL